MQKFLIGERRMKKSSGLACAVLSFLSAFPLFASGVENKTNMSTGYLRNPSRNSEAKRPEASYYNIAGTAFMEDGLIIQTTRRQSGSIRTRISSTSATSSPCSGISVCTRAAAL